MEHILVGILACLAIWIVVLRVKKHKIKMNWWKWTLVVLVIAYSVLAIEVIFGFLAEDVPKAALVTGSVLGIPAVIFNVLLWRFLLTPKNYN